MIHSPHGIFQIFTYSCTHKNQLTPLIIHVTNDIILIIPKDMVVLWDEAMYYSSFKQERLSLMIMSLSLRNKYKYLAISGPMFPII